MKRLSLLTFLIMILFPLNVHAEWKEFDAGAEFNFKLGDINITIKPGDHSRSSFKEDNFTMIINKGRATAIKQDFVSSYGRGKIYFKAGLLFLEYGIGRGTSVRTEHIKVFSFSDDLATDEFVELCDIQKSYYFQDPMPNTITPYKVEYQVKIFEDKQNVRLVFELLDKGFELPDRKEMILKKIVNKSIQRSR